MTKDLVILVPDKNTKFALEGILPRHHGLNIKKIEYDIFVHFLHDPGVYKNAVEFLRPFLTQYQYALVFFDREGCGQEIKPASQISDEVKGQLERNGWSGRAEVVVFDPELEIWAWVDSAHLVEILGWSNYPQLRNHVIQKGLWQENAPKPDRPKEAFELALRLKKIPRSSSIYKEIAEKVRLDGCIEPSFKKFRTTLREWFCNED